MTTDAAGERRHPEPAAFSRWEAVWRQVPLLLGLVALWVFLWDHVDVLTVTTGVLLAIAVTRALYLPPVLLSGRFNPWRGLLLGLRMMFDVVVASIQVAMKAVWPTWQPANSIIDVQLLTRSDLVTTLTAEAISVVTNGLALAAHFGDGTLHASDLAGGIVGAVVRDPLHDDIAWREYLEGVVRDRDGWGDFYDACHELG